MLTVKDLHPKAMDLAEMAFRHRRRGEEDRAKSLFLEAMEMERKAALLLPAKQESEPSRSILYRSAASLAFNAAEFETADWLIANGLSGFPPHEIKEELKNLYDDVNFMRHLTAKGIELSDEQWLMTIAGNATAHGVTPVDQLLQRVEKLSTIFYRTVERLLKIPYRISGGVNKEIKDLYGLYVTALMPGSFAIKFQLGHPNPQLSLFADQVPRKPVDPDTVIDEVLKCFRIIESPEPRQLREHILDETYYENFVGLAKQIAPDGDQISVVGFTTMRNGKEGYLALRKNRQQLRETPELRPQGDTEREGVERKTYKGILRYASSPINRKFGTVKLNVAETGSTLAVKVPISIMKDVVQPFYEERVVIVVSEKGNERYLEEVTLDT